MNDSIQVSEITVKVKSPISKLGLSSMSAVELNVYHAILSSFKNVKEEDPIRTFTFSDFRKLAQLPRDYIRNEKMEDFLIKMSEKVVNANVKLFTKDYHSTFGLFERFTVDLNKKTISIVMTKTCCQFFNNYILGHYTCFPLIELLTLKSKYAKNLYRTLARYKFEGSYECEYNHFITNVLGCTPKTERYKVNSKIISPAVKELNDNNCFENLTTYFIKDSKNPKVIDKIGFRFTPFSRQKEENGVQSTYVSEADKEFGKVLESVERAETNDGLEESFALFAYDLDLRDWNSVNTYSTLEDAKLWGCTTRSDDKIKIIDIKENKIVYTNTTDEEIEELQKQYDSNNSLPF